MIEIKFKSTTLELYDNIDQLPIERFNKANKYWMLHDQIGSSIEDFDKNHFAKLRLLYDNKDKFLKELDNFRILVYNIMNEINVEHLSFGCLIFSINNREITDFSESSLKRLLNELSVCGLTQGLLKKKLAKQENQSMSS